jgi:hypothetical protein
MGRVVVGRVSMGRVVREPVLAISAKKTSFQLFSLFYVDPGKILSCWNVVIYSLALDSYTLHLECKVYRSCTNNRNSTSTPSNLLASVYSVGASLHSSHFGRHDDQATPQLDTVTLRPTPSDTVTIRLCPAAAMRHNFSYTIRLRIFRPGLFRRGLIVTVT